MKKMRFNWFIDGLPAMRQKKRSISWVESEIIIICKGDEEGVNTPETRRIVTAGECFANHFRLSP